jgi:predicted enzyme related to lactoylglutathione lyase
MTKAGAMRADGALLYVCDVAKAAAYYRSAFGFAATKVTSAELTIVELDGWRLYLHREAQPPKTRGDGAVLQFRADDVDAWAAWHEKGGHAILRKPATFAGARECTVTDPDGHRLVVFTPLRR